MQVFDPFADSLASKHTGVQYKIHITRFKKNIMKEEYDQNDIIGYLVGMKNEGLSYAYRNLAFSAIKHLSEMNDLLFNWKKISKFLGEHTFDNILRSYTVEEIQKLLDVASIEYRAIILTYASTGMRREALIGIQSDDMEYLPDYRLYKIMIYRKTRYEQICFTTPEAAQAIKLYLETRERKLRDDSYFHKTTPEAITVAFRELCVRAGLSQTKHRTDSSIRGRHRNTVPAVHGLRKFCITQMARAKVDTEIAKILTGHTIGVRGRYLNYSADDLLNEYLKAINLLTISQENRLKKQVEQLTKEDDELKALRAEFNDLKKKLEGS